ncbi:Protein NAPE-1 [Aphelenchoides avenae]|nr:Protein NAPE-1 [Aphelenchus avenae]
MQKLPTDDVGSLDLNFAQPVVKNGKYSNPASFGYVRPSVPNVARFFLCEKNFSAIPADPKILSDTLPVVKPNFESGADLAMTWIGHATVLVQMEGIAFITDPIWVLKASPFSFVGPGRYRPAPCTISELPELAFGVISHNHYDHLSDIDVRELSLRNPNMAWFVPAGLKSWMQSRVSGNTVHEMTWGQKHTFVSNGNHFDVWCIPAQHNSMRYAFDYGKALWCGWAVVGPNKRFFFAGDSGLCRDEYRKLGEKLGPFDLAAIPIGAYAPRFLMKGEHMDPHDAVEVHKLIRSKKSVGIHWGTYNMGTYEHYMEPRELLREVVEGQKIPAESFVTVKHGETLLLD